MLRRMLGAPSVEIRFRVNDDVVFESSAEMMYYAAKYSGHGEDGWWDVLNAEGFGMATIHKPARVSLEFKPVKTEMEVRMFRFWLYFVLYFVAGMVSGGALMWAVIS